MTYLSSSSPNCLFVYLLLSPQTIDGCCESDYNGYQASLFLTEFCVTTSQFAAIVAYSSGGLNLVGIELGKQLEHTREKSNNKLAGQVQALIPAVNLPSIIERSISGFNLLSEILVSKLC